MPAEPETGVIVDAVGYLLELATRLSGARREPAVPVSEAPAILPKAAAPSPVEESCDYLLARSAWPPGDAQCCLIARAAAGSNLPRIPRHSVVLAFKLRSAGTGQVPSRQKMPSARFYETGPLS